MPRAKRTAPTANYAPYKDSRGFARFIAAEGRFILLHTGRGDLRVSAEEAEELAKQLVTAAEEARRRHPHRARNQCEG